jgi:hypothetical protein
VPPGKHFIVDAAKPTEENIQGILDKIEQEAGR